MFEATPLEIPRLCLTHRTVMCLVAIAIGGKPSPELKDELTQSDPQLLAKIARNHQVHTLLYSAFASYPELQSAIPKDLFLYFSLIHSANQKRNLEAKEELETLGQLFQQAKIKAVILKGGAEIIQPYYANPGHRFISDLDILIPEEKIDAAKNILFARGGISNPEDASIYQDHHHLPVIEGDALPFRIELHRRIGNDLSNELLSADEIFEHSLPSDITGIRVPSPQDRFMHHLIHGQIESKFYQRTLLNLRNCVDHYYLKNAMSDETIEITKTKLDEHNLLDAFTGLDELALSIFTNQTIANPWAIKAMAHFERPHIQKHVDTFIWIRTYLVEFLKNPSKRKTYLRKIFSFRGWKHFITFHKDRLKRFT